MLSDAQQHTNFNVYKRNHLHVANNNKMDGDLLYACTQQNLVLISIIC